MDFGEYHMPETEKKLYQMKAEVKRYHMPYIFIYFSNAVLSKNNAENCIQTFLVIFAPNKLKKGSIFWYSNFRYVFKVAIGCIINTFYIF